MVIRGLYGRTHVEAVRHGLERYVPGDGLHVNLTLNIFEFITKIFLNDEYIFEIICRSFEISSCGSHCHLTFPHENHILQKNKPFESLISDHRIDLLFS